MMKSARFIGPAIALSGNRDVQAFILTVSAHSTPPITVWLLSIRSSTSRKRSALKPAHIALVLDSTVWNRPATSFVMLSIVMRICSQIFSS